MTHRDIQQLEPTGLWQAFVELNAIPRASKKETAVSQFVAGWGRKLGLETKTDSWGNVLIRKPGTKGYENHPTIVLQSHIDMVWQKNSSSDFDFETQGIQMLLDGDWVRARGTTLGADNGIGVATMLATLASKSMAHPPLECLFTIDEETGMTGAKELDPTWLTGKVLLNLDTEEDNSLTIGCAGGADVTAESTYEPEAIETGYVSFEIHVKGLKGGHSGMEIHLGRANANKVMNRLLFASGKMFGLRLAKLEGGGLRNAIPRESRAIVFIPKDNVRSFEQWLASHAAVIKAENSVTDPDLTVECQLIQASSSAVLPQSIQARLVSVVSGVLSGIHRMSPSIAGLVQTSNNLARVIVDQGKIVIMCLARSSVDSERDYLTDCLTSVLEQQGGDVQVSGQYPGWQPEPHSNIVQLMTTVYSELFGEPPHVEACHAGLECGIIGSKSPGMEMISFGPNIRGAHSPDECVQISSVQKFSRYYEEILRRL